LNYITYQTKKNFNIREKTLKVNMSSSVGFAKRNMRKQAPTVA